MYFFSTSICFSLSIRTIDLCSLRVVCNSGIGIDQPSRDVDDGGAEAPEGLVVRMTPRLLQNNDGPSLSCKK